MNNGNTFLFLENNFVLKGGWLFQEGKLRTKSEYKK